MFIIYLLENCLKMHKFFLNEKNGPTTQTQSVNFHPIENTIRNSPTKPPIGCHLKNNE